MISHRVLTPAQEQAKIDAARDFYLSRGGKINEVKPFEFKPFPKRKHPDLAPVTRASQANAEPPQESPRVAQIRELAATMTIQQASGVAGLSISTLYRISVEGGFNFRDGREQNRGRATDKAEDARKCERLKALRDVGLSRHQVAMQMQISNKQLDRLISNYGIDFPKQKRKR